MSLNSDRKRTPTIKKGGQTPEWDSELRFEVWQDMQDELQSEMTATGGIKPFNQSSLSKGESPQRVIKSGPGKDKKVLNVAVFADDPKDPDLVGEAIVELDTVLKKGEYDGMCGNAAFLFRSQSAFRMGLSSLQGPLRWRSLSRDDVLLGGVSRKLVLDTVRCLTVL